MDQFIKLPDTDRKAIFQEAAVRRNILPIILEKDFWVCWTLKQLFESPRLSPYLTFKGGTSLSKAYGLIERFSEDIDLTISRNAKFLENGMDPMEADISTKERSRRIETLKQNAHAFVSQLALTELQAVFKKKLGDSNKKKWSITLDANDREGQTILFSYPNKSEFGYIKPIVRLEFGARGEIDPHETKAIRSYIAEDFPNLFEITEIQVPTLGSERTFWEKATILHAIYHGSKSRDRMSRHYYDLFMMDRQGVTGSALQKPELLGKVVHNKSLLFKDSKASYETAKIGQLRLTPSADLLNGLRKDYQAMQEMFMSEPPDFETIISSLKQLENRINQIENRA